MKLLPPGMSRVRFAAAMSIVPAAFIFYAWVSGGPQRTGLVLLAASTALAVDAALYLYLRQLRSYFGPVTGAASLVVAVAVVVAVVSLAVPRCPSGTGERCSPREAVDSAAAAGLVAIAFACVVAVPGVLAASFKLARRVLSWPARRLRPAAARHRPDLSRTAEGDTGRPGDRGHVSERESAVHAAAVRRRQAAKRSRRR